MVTFTKNSKSIFYCKLLLQIGFNPLSYYYLVICNLSPDLTTLSVWIKSHSHVCQDSASFDLHLRRFLSGLPLSSGVSGSPSCECITSRFWWALHYCLPQHTLAGHLQLLWALDACLGARCSRLVTEMAKMRTANFPF